MKVNPLLLLVIPLLFLSGPFVNAGPVGDFFKKVGQSISKPLQPQPQPPQPARPEPTKTPHATRRPTSRAAPAAAATPSAVAKPSQSLKEEEFTGTVRGVSAADMEKVKAGLPYGIPIPGRKGHRVCVRVRRERSIHRKAFSGSVNMGIIRNGADGIQRHSLVSAGGLPKHAQGLLDSRFRTLRFDHVASRVVIDGERDFHGWP